LKLKHRTRPANVIVLFSAITWLVIPTDGADAAIVNSLRGFERDEPGWSGSLAGSYDANGGNTDDSTFAGSGRVQWRGRSNVWRCIVAGERKLNRGEETARSVLAHLRHNYLLTDRWATLAFLQLQRNPFQRLDARTLIGAGGRWQAMKGDRHLVYLGAAYMFEWEKIQDEPGSTQAQRLSSFLSVEVELRDDVFLDGLVFYQPEWSDFADWRFLGAISLDVGLTAALSLFTGFSVQYDSQPPVGVMQTDWHTKTGFRMKF
jgi:putative salt-induced outer membrane protein YdiY